MPPNGTPDTSAYLLLGLAVLVIILTLLIGSMVVRFRSLRKDEQVIEQLHNE
jgi:NhaP-type Na+/H+ or K+/H+ antiporter